MAVAASEPGAGRAHGTRTKYVWDRCRCLPCRAANSRYQCELDRRKGRSGLPYRVFYSPAARHWGVIDRETGEVVHRGERDETWDVFAELMQAAPRPDPIFASPREIAVVLRKVRELKAAGVGLRRLSEISGVSRSRLQEVVDVGRRRKGRPKVRHVKQETAERILFVPLDAARGAPRSSPPARPGGSSGNCARQAGRRRGLLPRLAPRRGVRRFRSAVIASTPPPPRSSVGCTTSSGAPRLSSARRVDAQDTTVARGDAVNEPRDPALDACPRCGKPPVSMRHWRPGELDFRCRGGHEWSVVVRHVKTLRVAGDVL